MGRPKRRREVPIATIKELLPGMEWLATHHTFDDGDTWLIRPGRVAEYDHDRAALVVREHGKEIGFIPVFGNLRR